MCSPTRPRPQSSGGLHMTKTVPQTIALYYGGSRRPLIYVVPDDRRPGMWRLAWPDGRLSNLVNLARAKDAAVAICERGPPARNRRRFTWKKERSDAVSEAPPMRRRAPAYVQAPPSAKAIRRASPRVPRIGAVP